MQQNEIQRSLGRIEGKLEHIDSSIDEMRGAVQGIDGRLRAVELKSGVISVTISSAIAALGYTLGNPPA